MSSVIGERMNAIAHIIERRLDDELTPLVLGEGLRAHSKKVAPTGEKVTVGALVHLAVLNDALVIAERAVMQDGVITAEEKAYMTPLAQAAVRYLVHFRKAYEEFADSLDVVDFLETHMNDSQPFGGKCVDTRWTGAQICRNYAINAGDETPLVTYRSAMARLVDDIFDLTKGADPRASKELRAEIELRSHLERSDAHDGRAIAFCSPSAQGVFHAVAHAAEVYERDPLDVEAIHAEARDVFSRTLSRVAAVNHQSRHGAMLLLKGESGAGKTHLMRAFRNLVHERRLGHVGYMQMTSASGSYARHVLSNLIDSLERPFLSGEPSSLMCIADAVMRWKVPAPLAERLREEAEPEARGLIVGQIVDQLVVQPEFSSVDVDLLRAFVFLAANDAVVAARAKRYLRCDGLSDYDRRLLGGITPPVDDNAPLRMIAGIGKIIAASHGGALVLLVDQLEDVYDAEVAQTRFRHLMDVLRQVTELVPTAFVVVASLGDFYEKLRGGLAKSLLDRLEQDPPPVRVTESRTREEIELLITTRVRTLLEQHGARARDDEPLWPFDQSHVSALAGLRTRDVLEWCREAHESCVRAGEIMPFAVRRTVAPPTPNESSDETPLAAKWAEHLTGFTMASKRDEELEALLAWAIKEAGRELDADVATTASDVIDVSFTVNGAKKRSVVAFCNYAPQGGGLARQVEALAHRAELAGARAVIVRASDFPPPKKNQVTEKLGDVIKKGGSKVVALGSDWRTIAALQAFAAQHGDAAGFERWVREERPMTRLKPVREVFAEELPTSRGAPAPRPVTQPPPKPPNAVPAGPVSGRVGGPVSAALGDIHLGRTRSLTPKDVTRKPESLMRHAAFLGSTGSGKTTLALNVVEQCLMRGVPALLVDRKGDLCRYASEGFWAETENDPDRAERKRLLRECVRVQVFTPGEHRGRPLALPVVPPGLADAEMAESNALATSAAAGLGSMMGYRASSQSDAARQAILAKAIEILAQNARRDDLGLGELIDLVHAEDPTLVDAIGKLDTRHFKALVDHLSTLKLRYESLLRGGEQLSAERLFGLEAFAAPGKATLSIISTKFLPDAGVIDFWVSRLLIELTRWSSRHPSPTLQALVMLDEADIYLPAQSKPATKQPVQDLLKRARSAGVGVFLATQSPGDLDYKCRDNVSSWFVGKIAEKTALEKMKPLLSDYRSNPAGKLAAAQPGEFFVLADSNVIELKAERALMNTQQLAEDEIIAAAKRGA